MNTITNNQGNHVYAKDIAKFIANGQKIPGNHAFKYIWRDFPLQQSSHLDKRIHKVSRAGVAGGEYPLGYKVCGYWPPQLLCLLTVSPRLSRGYCVQTVKILRNSRCGMKILWARSTTMMLFECTPFVPLKSGRTTMSLVGTTQLSTGCSQWDVWIGQEPITV